ncbi:MAG: hypothetical protein WKG52_00250 [Variovorax sp.]
MHQSPEVMQASRLGLLEAALLALMRDGQESGFDGLSVECSVDAGITVIDLTYTQAGAPISGHSL